jgi:hypothetical protein
MFYIKNIKMAKKKVETIEIKEKIYPSLILGLDISTACIGISIVYDDGKNEPEIIKITHVVPKIDKKIKGIEALILRKEIFEKEFLENIKDMGITECIIESPLNYATGNSNAQTVSQLLQFNGLLSEAVYRVLHIVPTYISSYDARMKSFPELMALRKFNKKARIYPITHIKKALKDEHLVLFGSYPFDCDKKNIMMNLVCEKYPNINWVFDSKGNLKKENYDACDSLICALAYINEKKHGEFEAKIKDDWKIEEINTNEYIVRYTTQIWDTEYKKQIYIKTETENKEMND